MRKKSPQVALERFRHVVGEVRDFIAAVAADGANGQIKARCYDHAVIWTYRAFEEFVLDILVAQINKDPSHLYDNVGVRFGANPTVAQCEYLLVGDRYFDFRGHSGLVVFVKKVSPANSALETAVKDAERRKAFEILVGLRNYVSHESDQSKVAALRAMRHWEPNRKNLGSAGQWLRVQKQGQTRLERLFSKLDELAESMKEALA